MTVLASALQQDQPDHVVDVQVLNGYVRRQDSATASVNSSHLPCWVQDLKVYWGEELVVPEWQDDDDIIVRDGDDDDADDADDDGVALNYRTKHGWKGRDFIHDPDSAVRILKYYVKYGDGRLDENISSNNNEDDDYDTKSQKISTLTRGGCGTELTGVVHFTKRAESHQGYCHGGSMTSVLDDVIGWAAFLTTGECRPWSGYTVQVNCSLKRPIAVDSVLLVQAKITHVERRKVSVEASIIDPDADNAVHASGTGLVVLNRGVLPQHDTNQ